MTATGPSKSRVSPTEWWKPPPCPRLPRNDRGFVSVQGTAAFTCANDASAKERLMSSVSTVPAEKPYPLPGLIAFSSVGIPLAGMLLIFGLWTGRFYVTNGLSLVIVGGAILVVRMIDIAIDPILALAMDRTRTPIGRYRPWMILGVPFLVFGVYK